MCIFGDDFRRFWETLAQTIILRPRNLLRAMILESRKKSENSRSCKSATRLVCFAGTNVLKICGRGFGRGNGRGLVGCDGISHHIPIAFSFPEILHATRVSTNTVLIQSLMHLRILRIQNNSWGFKHSDPLKSSPGRYSQSVSNFVGIMSSWLLLAFPPSVITSTLPLLLGILNSKLC